MPCYEAKDCYYLCGPEGEGVHVERVETELDDLSPTLQLLVAWAMFNL
ncbi:hypothetical protein H8744_08945 [Oscillospiraceae bacterium N12]|jgi:hypothetical protein|uniref:Uncharacterized protein n=1 Tax=Jilunia laotingensis TaxID=2763675 RepID=A0A926IPJ9_9BACT|nr:hypothetical protein [Jilunia laotingensis]MBC8593369.1 hypothetical protein [Jilunia laotingensis]